jgi:chromosomal replication initiation ATPase DnaA
MITRAEIIKAIADSTSVTELEIIGKCQISIVVIARQLYFNCARCLTNYTNSYIGEYVGRDETTVINGIRRIDKLEKENNQLLCFMIENVAKKYPHIVKHLIREGVTKTTTHDDQR